MTCKCKCHPERSIPPNCWCPNCMDDHIDFNKLIADIKWCEYCGDGIPSKQLKEHHEWCIPMTQKREKERRK